MNSTEMNQSNTRRFSPPCLETLGPCIKQHSIYQTTITCLQCMQGWFDKL